MLMVRQELFQFNSILFTFRVSYTGKHTIDLETVQLTKHVVKIGTSTACPNRH